MTPWFPANQKMFMAGAGWPARFLAQKSPGL
jgi:hypothetical protein